MSKWWNLIVILLIAGCYDNDKAKSEIYSINDQGIGANIGTIEMQDTPFGLELIVDLQGLPQGEHGFHVHEFGNCNASTDGNGKMTAGLKAGGHFDPQKTGKHLGPDKHGHKGDLPYLTADDKGIVKTKIYVPHLKVKDIKARSLMIHQNGDNYQDAPLPLGGGGARIACGVVK